MPTVFGHLFIRNAGECVDFNIEELLNFVLAGAVTFDVVIILVFSTSLLVNFNSLLGSIFVLSFAVVIAYIQFRRMFKKVPEIEDEKESSNT